MLQKYDSVAMRWDWWKRLIPVILLWKRTSDSGNCILNEVKENWSPTTVIRTSLDQRDYAPTFPVYHDYLTTKQSQLTYRRSNGSQPDCATPVLELNLFEYTFGMNPCRWIIKKKQLNLRETTVFFSTRSSNDKIAVKSKM